MQTYLQCALLSMVPVIELRGALPWAIAHGLPAVPSYFLCVFFNLLPVPFILIFLKKVLTWMDTTKRLCRISHWVETYAQKKLDAYYKYEVLGLFLLVAVPLPGTGAWTGALVAALLGMKPKNAIPSIILGVAAAGIIMLTVSIGAVAVLG